MADERLPLNTTGQAIDTPEGKVRNGNRWPYKKATREEVAGRVIFVRGLLAKGAYESEVRQFLYRRYNVRHRQAGVYIARAKALLLAESGITREQARCDAIALYNSLVRESSDDKVKLLARKRLDDLFGLDAAPKAPVGPDGEAVPAASISITTIRAMLADERGRELLAGLAEYGAGLPTPAEHSLPEYGLKELPPGVAERLNGGTPPAAG
jgi:hypothetical protein